MAKRSPILGYNHNIRHRGLVFHVQTEDSGVDNPHIFTHLFHGGVIINTRKLVYDAEADEDVVKSLMQAQHKAMLKDLKGGKFGRKIDQYLGDNPDLQPFDMADGTARAETAPFRRVDLEELIAREQGTAPTVQLDQAPSDVSAAFAAVRGPVDDDPTVPVQAPSVPPATRPAGKPRQAPARTDTSVPVPVVTFADGAEPSGPIRGVYAQHRTRAADEVSRPPAPPAKPPPTPTQQRKQGGVVVSRPAVIVGAPPRVVGGGKSASPPRASAAPPASVPQPPQSRASTARVRKATEKAPENLFGQGLISEKSLDEVILAYLSDDSSEE